MHVPGPIKTLCSEFKHHFTTIYEAKENDFGLPATKRINPYCTHIQKY